MRKAVFLHVFKTGGTSINQWLAARYRNVYAPEDPARFRSDVLKYRKYIGSHDLITGHIYGDDALRLSATHRVLTVIRKPEAQLMSALWHLFANADSTTSRRPQRFDRDRDSLPALIRVAEQIAVTGAGMQALFLAPSRIDLSDPDQRRAKTEEALQTLSQIDVVGITERMPETIRLFARRLHVSPPWRSPHYRNAGAGRSGLTPELREILKHHLEIDQKLYDAAAKRFERDVSQMTPRRSLWH
ncbi:hypothetical protein ABWI00_21965 [Algihabitans albus]|uniref:hypothetical protein n=1 Tax=Algihabitans albus TaxID=2164067 RepID=UPI0035CFBDD7